MQEVPFTNTHTIKNALRVQVEHDIMTRQQTNDPVTCTFSIFYTYYDLILFVGK